MVKLTVAAYLEVGSRRVFAGALDWPGWCRSGRNEDMALRALVAYAPRYAVAIGPLAHGLTVPTDTAALDVVERLDGNATTDFGAPAVAPAADDRPLDGSELERLQGLLRACWAAFDAAAEAGSSAVLRKGPRGGGRKLEAIVAHVIEADASYLSAVGWKAPKRAMSAEPAKPSEQLSATRESIIAALRATTIRGKKVLVRRERDTRSPAPEA